MVTRVRVDVHERQSTLFALLAKDREIAMDVVPLREGDYLIANQVLIERKSAADFRLSVENHRLFHQAYRLKHRRDVVSIVVVEGWSEIGRARRLGAQLTLALAYGIPVIGVAGPSELVWLIKRIGRLVDRSRTKPHVPTLQRARNPAQRAQNVLGQLPGIGARKSKNLLRHFGSLRGVLMASEAELAAVNGIGLKLAKRITALLDAEQRGNEKTHTQGGMAK